MSKKINIDDSIREKLDGFSAVPPPHVWDNIQTQMDAMQKKRRLAYIGWISAAAVVVLAFIAGWFFNDKTIVEQPVMVEQQVTVPATDKDVANQQENRIETTNRESKDDADMFIAENKEKPVSTESQPKSITTSLFAEDKNIDSQSQTHDVERRDSYSLLERIETIFTPNLSEEPLKEKGREIEVTMITPADEVLIAENLRNLDIEKSPERGWIVGAQVSPGYSSHSANHNDDYSRNMTYDSNDGGSNVGGGISVQYKTSKRLRVESGVYYAKDGQKAQNSFNLFARNDLDYTAAPEASYDGSAPAFSNVVQTGSSGIAMNSTAGVIEMKTAPRGANISANLENTNDALANRMYADGEFSQVFEFVEVPLYLRYSVLDKKLGVDILGGINAGFVIGNNAYLDNDYGVQNIGSTADISTLNFSGTVGVGFNYMMGKHFSFALEPRLNYYLNSINSNPDIDYRPYRIGVYTGVYYEF